MFKIRKGFTTVCRNGTRYNNPRREGKNRNNKNSLTGGFEPPTFRLTDEFSALFFKKSCHYEIIILYNILYFFYDPQIFISYSKKNSFYAYFP